MKKGLKRGHPHPEVHLGSLVVGSIDLMKKGLKPLPFLLQVLGRLDRSVGSTDLMKKGLKRLIDSLTVRPHLRLEA